MITRNSTPKAPQSVAESEITELREDMFWELCTTGSVFVNSHQVTIFELLEEMDVEEKDNIAGMLIIGNEDAKEYALEKLFIAFASEYDDEAIQGHYIDDKTSY
jgi:hypothetical protein